MSKQPELIVACDNNQILNTYRTLYNIPLNSFLSDAMKILNNRWKK
ncbi:MAG: hypothetical protein ACN4E2_00495 [Nitrospinota bacterium]